VIRNEHIVQIDCQEIPHNIYFHYLGPTSHQHGGMEENVIHRIETGRLKWRRASGVKFDHKIYLKLNGKNV